MFNNQDIFTCCLFSLLKKKNDNRPAKTLAYDISHKINGGLLRLESFIFYSRFFFFLNFTGVEKTQADTVPQNDFENDAAKGSITGDVVL